MRAILVYATSPGVLLGFLHDNGTDDEHDGENGNDADYGDVNRGHNLVHDDNNHNGEKLHLGWRSPSLGLADNCNVCVFQHLGEQQRRY